MSNKRTASKFYRPDRTPRRRGNPLASFPAALRLIQEEAMGSMAPGDFILLEEAESLRCAVESLFFAVLACPACGTLGLITSVQYAGFAPITCCSSQCSCRFRIDEDGRFVYLPVD